MNTTYDTETTGQRSNTIAAIFATEHDARDGIKNLHKAGFKKTWLGKMREADRDTGEPTVEADGGGIARFLSAGAERRPLHKALMERGLSETQAQAVESDIAPGNIIVTVYGEDNPDRAAECLQDAKGAVIDAAGAIPTAVRDASLDPRTGVDKDDRDRDADVAPMRDDAAMGTVPTERGDYRGDATTPELEGYETEEFIATGRGYTG
jgi:hypothetical protein